MRLLLNVTTRTLTGLTKKRHEVHRMEIAELHGRELKTASFAARLRRLRIAYHDGAVRDFTGIPHGLFTALAKSADPEAFLRDRIDGVYPTTDVIRAA
jgi:hypothetical protein